MKNVLILSSSPRVNGNSDLLCQEFYRGAADAGHNVEIIRLNEKDINYCIGCYACHKTGTCFRKDDMVDLKSFFQKTSYINNNRIYLIEEVHKLNSTSANMILKFLEEPMKGVIAFFITDNLDAVLPTIKSRCQIVNTFYGDSKEIDNGNKEYLELNKVLFVDNKYYSLLKIKKKYEKKERNELIIMFKDLLEYYYNLDFNKENISRIKLLNESINLLNCNVNTDYVFDYILLGGLNV